MSQNIRELAGMHKGLEYAVDSEVLIHTTRLIGVEVEVEGVKNLPTKYNLPVWKLVDEYSLRNHGREYISQPMMGNDIPEQLTYLYNALKEYNPDSLEFSSRCSIHLHIDCRRKELEELYNVTRNYAFLEYLLFKYIGHNRINNIYCVPLCRSDSLLLNAAKILSTDKRFVDTLNQSGTKYSAYNLLPLIKHGTIEWRHHPGSLEVDEVLDWINIVLCVMESGHIDVVKEFQDGGISHVLDQVFGPMASTLVPHVDDDTILNGLKAARNFDLLFELYRGSKGVLKCRHQRSALHKLSNGEL